MSLEVLTPDLDLVDVHAVVSVRPVTPGDPAEEPRDDAVVERYRLGGLPGAVGALALNVIGHTIIVAPHRRTPSLAAARRLAAGGTVPAGARDLHLIAAGSAGVSVSPRLALRLVGRLPFAVIHL